MTAWLLLFVALLPTGAGRDRLPPPRLPLAGMAYHYHPYPDPYGRSMRQVAANRGLPLTPSVDGYASTPWCSHLGDNVIAIVAGERVVLQQVDCSGADVGHQRRVLDLVVEVDWSLAHGQGWTARDYGHGATGDGKAPATLIGWSLGAYPCPESCRHPK